MINLFKSSATREKHSIPDFEPTDLQAEIIVLERLPWSYVKKVYFPNSTEYLTDEEVRKIVRKLPTGDVLQSQVKDEFPDIDWKNMAIVTEYYERRRSTGHSPRVPLPLL